MNIVIKIIEGEKVIDFQNLIKIQKKNTDSASMSRLLVQWGMSVVRRQNEKSRIDNHI